MPFPQVKVPTVLVVPPKYRICAKLPPLMFMVPPPLRVPPTVSVLAAVASKLRVLVTVKLLQTFAVIGKFTVTGKPGEITTSSYIPVV